MIFVLIFFGNFRRSHGIYFHVASLYILWYSLYNPIPISDKYNFWHEQICIYLLLAGKVNLTKQLLTRRFDPVEVQGILCYGTEPSHGRTKFSLLSASVHATSVEGPATCGKVNRVLNERSFVHQSLSEIKEKYYTFNSYLISKLLFARQNTFKYSLCTGRGTGHWSIRGMGIWSTDSSTHCSKGNGAGNGKYPLLDFVGIFLIVINKLFLLPHRLLWLCWIQSKVTG